MQYKDLKKMTIKDWDGEPFNAVCCDYDGCEICDSDKIRFDCPDKCTLIVGYLNGEWRTEGGLSWTHVYPIEWNKDKDKVEEFLNPKPKRMTHRQLAMWLAKGNGQVKYGTGYLSANHGYPEGTDHEETTEEIRVRKWDSEEWVEPTVDLLEGV